MSLVFKEDQQIKEFLIQNRQNFEGKLLTEAKNVKEKIEEIHLIGNINLLENAHKLVLFVVEQRDEELVAFARVEGIAWAKHSLTLAFKLEWVQAIRRTLWNFLYNYDRLNGIATSRDDFFAMEKRMNEKIDQFLNEFFITYSKYKDELIESQREMVVKLSVPIIPISHTVCILPLIGTVDSFRASTIEEKVLREVGSLHIQTLIMDLSGIAEMEPEVIDHILKILDGLSMMGCKAVITGLRPEIVRKLIHMGISFDRKAETKGTLQQALKEYLTFS